MKDFDHIKEECRNTSELLEGLADEYLIYYAASYGKVRIAMEKRFARYEHIAKELDEKPIAMMKAQYLAHQIFRKGGLVDKFVNHSAIQLRSEREIAYLRWVQEHPWRFSFAMIRQEVAPDFFEMIDVFKGGTYLLHSPAMNAELEEKGAVNLWLNLICDNGSCYQTYGPVYSYLSFGPDDIFFFATELAELESDDDLVQMVEENPVPFMMLLWGAHMPLVVNKGHRLVRCIAEYDFPELDTTGLKNDFTMQYVDGVYQLELPDRGEFPHYAVAYYDEAEELLQLTAMTDEGFVGLAEALNAHGLELEPEPHVRVSPTMLHTAEDVLKRDINLVPYERKFHQEPSPQKAQTTDKLNEMMNEVVPLVNAGQQPDIAQLASDYDVPEETAREIVEHLLGLMGRK